MEAGRSVVMARGTESVNYDQLRSTVSNEDRIRSDETTCERGRPRPLLYANRDSARDALKFRTTRARAHSHRCAETSRTRAAFLPNPVNFRVRDRVPQQATTGIRNVRLTLNIENKQRVC